MWNFITMAIALISKLWKGKSLKVKDADDRTTAVENARDIERQLEEIKDMPKPTPKGIINEGEDLFK